MQILSVCVDFIFIYDRKFFYFKVKTIMNKFLIVLSSLSFFVSAEELVFPKVDISGFTLQGGLSNLGGDLGNYGIGSNGKTIGFSLGGSYTFQTGFIVGALYTPQLAIDSFAMSGISSSVTMNSLNFFAGYQLDNKIRLTGGITRSEMEVAVSSNDINGVKKTSSSDINLGIGYEFNSGWSFETRFSSLEFIGIKGNAFNFLAGYKF